MNITRIQSLSFSQASTTIKPIQLTQVQSTTQTLYQMRLPKNNPPSYSSRFPFSSSDLCTFLAATLVLLPCVLVFSLLAIDHHNNYTSHIHSLFNESIPSATNAKRSSSHKNGSSKIEDELARARLVIQKAAQNSSPVSCHEDPDYVPKGPIYRNPNAFHRSYLEMEKLFKIYVYKEGEPPMFHSGPCKSLYSSEGKFIHDMEKGGSPYRTNDPTKAHVFFLPFSVVMMVQYLHEPGVHHIDPIGNTVKDYVNVVRTKYGFWNRSHGSDHFMLSCHDWGPWATRYESELYNNSIRALCNANTSEGFNPSKDVSFPEINLVFGNISPASLGGLPPSRRSVLAFFAGRLHGHIRSLLFDQWKNISYTEGDSKDAVLVYDKLPPEVSYSSMLKKSRFCLCPSGYEVASPRVVEAIYADCVPVLISDGYALPFNDVLNWDSFSIKIKVEDIPKIKSILLGISMRRYMKMQGRIRQVKRHFFVNKISKRFDVFHMIVHSIWLRRLNIRIEEPQESNINLVKNIIVH